jgi:NADH-quinone oxidoreductase subunit J
MMAIGLPVLWGQVAFYYMAVISVVSAILAVTRRNPVHSMLWVLGLFLHVAGIFLLLGAEFLAGVQVIVYAGAILVFYLFVLMLLDLPSEEMRPRFGGHWPFAAAVGLSFAALAWLGGFFGPTLRAGSSPPVPPEGAAVQFSTSPPEGASNLSEVGTALFGPFALPFEMVSLVLLAAIVGAVVLARKRAGS